MYDFPAYSNDKLSFLCCCITVSIYLSSFGLGIVQQLRSCPTTLTLQAMPATKANDKLSDKQPAQGGGLQPAPGGGLQPALEAGTAPPLDAALDDDQSMSPQEFLRRFSSERRLIPLNRLGVHKINRKGKPLNGAQVLSLMMRFRKGSKGGGEDVCRFRWPD